MIIGQSLGGRAMPSPNEITIAQLMRLIGTPAAPVIVDVCIDEDHAADPRLIPGSFRHPFTRIEELAPRLQGRNVVIVCQRGRKLSQGAAALLRVKNIRAEYLQGGIVAWREAGAPLVPVKSILGEKTTGHTRWVTRHRPKIDRIACPWLIKRFIDPEAVFMFVAPDNVLEVADRFDATPFDIEGVHWSHRGNSCTFDVMIDEFKLNLEPLKHLANIVRGADTNCHDLAPEAAGLLAISLGLSRMYRDDLEQLEAGMTVYDALFRWARDATGEGHDWPSSSIAA
jgi:rhodanese-related sulfurtransferase